MPTRAPTEKPEAQPLWAVRRGLLPAALIAEAAGALEDMLRALGAQGPDLDACVDHLAVRDRAALAAVYDAMRETLVFRRIVTADALIWAAADLVGSERLHSPFQHAVFRMDLAHEPWRGFGWHQDFPYNALCANSVTAWIPLTASGASNGGVDLVPAESVRIFPVEIRRKRDPEGRPLGGRDAFIPERFHAAFEAGAIKPETQAGDALIFHNSIVHRSGRNPGPRHRYSIQVRFGDLMAPDVLARRWRNRRADGFETFAALHPDLVELREDA